MKICTILYLNILNKRSKKLDRYRKIPSDVCWTTKEVDFFPEKKKGQEGFR